MNVFFSVTAIIFALVNGQPAAEPEKLYNPSKFETMDQCRDWMGSPDFVPVRARLSELVTQNWGPGTAFTTVCEQHTPADFKSTPEDK